MDAETYRRMQLEAVTGHGGTSEQEIIKVTSWLVVAALAWRLLKLKPGRVSTFLIEFGLLILPQIILFCYPQWARWIIASVAVPSLLLAITNDRFGEGSQLVSTANPPRHITPSDSPHVAFLTNTRAAIMIMCVIGILAVDFPSVFPRRFAKTETVGISLMDMGVGCVIVSLGLTAARRHLGATMMGRRDTKESDRSTVNSRSSLSSPSLWAVMRSTLPLLILGVARMLAVKALDYQEHVGEYGLHWNFFMTLGCLPMLLWLFLGLGRMPLRWSFTMGCLLGLAYETILQKTSLATWASLDLNEALKASKLPFWLVANKEGLISLVGYVSLYLMSLGVGSDLITEMGSLGRANWPVCRRVIKKLIFLIISYGVCTRGLDLQPSRRLMNFPFALGSLALTLIQMTGFLLIDLLLPPVSTTAVDADQTPMIVAGINFNQLALFLLANLLTGIINLTSYTLLQPAGVSLAIIGTYMFILCCVAAYWYLGNLRWRL